MSDTETRPSPHPLFEAHKAAWMNAGREATAAVVIKHGGHGGPGGIHHVPASKIKACLADLEKLAGSSSPRATKAAASFEAIRSAAYGDKPKPAAVPKSFDDLAAKAYQKWNSAKPKPKPEDA